MGRNEQENRKLLTLAPEDARVLEWVEPNGPVTLLLSEASPDDQIQAAQLTLHYSDFLGVHGKVNIVRGAEKKLLSIKLNPLIGGTMERWRK